MMNFSDALKHLKNGGKIARIGWNGSDMHLYLKNNFADFKAINNIMTEVTNTYEPCIVMYTAQGKHQPGWLASQADLLAEDWTVVR